MPCSSSDAPPIETDPKITRDESNFSPTAHRYRSLRKPAGRLGKVVFANEVSIGLGGVGGGSLTGEVAKSTVGLCVAPIFGAVFLSNSAKRSPTATLQVVQRVDVAVASGRGLCGELVALSGRQGPRAASLRRPNTAMKWAAND